MKELDRLDDSQMKKLILERAAREGWSKQRVFDEVSKLCRLVVPVPEAADTTAAPAGGETAAPAPADTNAAPAGGETAAPAPAKQEASNPTVAPWKTGMAGRGEHFFGGGVKTEI